MRKYQRKRVENIPFPPQKLRLKIQKEKEREKEILQTWKQKREQQEANLQRVSPIVKKEETFLFTLTSLRCSIIQFQTKYVQLFLRPNHLLPPHHSPTLPPSITFQPTNLS